MHGPYRVVTQLNKLKLIKEVATLKSDGLN